MTEMINIDANIVTKMNEKIDINDAEHKELLSELVEDGLLESIEVENDTLYRPSTSAKYKINKSLISLSSTNNSNNEDLLFNSSIMTLKNDGVLDEEHNLKLSFVLYQVFKDFYGLPKVREIDHSTFFYYMNKINK